MCVCMYVHSEIWRDKTKVDELKQIYNYVAGQSVLKNQPRDVIKMREVRGEVGKKTL